MKRKLRRALLAEEEAIVRQLQPLAGNHRERHADAMDEATQAAHDAVEDQRRAFLLRRLHGVRAALERIRDGEFGLCERCGEPITPARLEALPWATLCRECQQEEERDEVYCHEN